MSSEEDQFDGEILNVNPSPNSLGSTPLEFSDVAGSGSIPTAAGCTQEEEGPGAFYSCPVCRKELKSKSGFNRHVLVHTVNDYSFRKPLEEEIKAQLPQVFQKVYDKIKTEPCVSDLKFWTIKLVDALSVENECSPQFREAVSTPIINCILERTKVIPSAQFEDALTKLNILMCDTVFCDDLKSKLLSCVPNDLKQSPSSIINRLVMYHIQEFVFQQMKKQHLNACKNFVMSESDRKEFIVHVGKIIRAVFKCGIKADNSVWKMRCRCLKEKFVVADASLTNDEFTNERVWQDNCVSLSQAATELFLGLERILQSFQDSDTTFSIDAFFRVFTKPENMFVLNHVRELSRGILPEDLAIDFLKDLVNALASLSYRLDARKKVEEAKKKQKTSNVSLRTNLKRNPKPSAKPSEATLQEKAPKEKASKKKARQEKAPKEKAPKEKASKKKAPKEKAPKEKAPKEKAPKEKAPKEKASKKKAPQEKASQEKAPKKAPIEKAPTPKKPKEKAKTIAEEKATENAPSTKDKNETSGKGDVPTPELRSSSRIKKPTERYNQ